MQEKTSLEAQLLKAQESAVHYRSRLTELEAAEVNNSAAELSDQTDAETGKTPNSSKTGKLLEHLQQERLRLQQELLREKQRSQELETASALELQSHKQEIERLKLENQLLQQQAAKGSHQESSGGFLFGLGAALRLCGPAKKADFDLATTI